MSRLIDLDDYRNCYIGMDGEYEQWNIDPNVIAEAQAEPQWIPCSERLPKQGQEVVCQCRANIIMILKLDAYGDWFQDVDHCYMSGFVIAWMPLPLPYRKEGE